jgi:death on curing protein
MKAAIIHLTVDVVKAIHHEVLQAHGGGVGVRDNALLESAVAAPQATMIGEPLFSDPIDIAASYMFYLCRNHPFVDGNKRVALASCLVFLEQHGKLPTDELDVDAWEQFTLAVAASELAREGTTKRLKKLLRQMRVGQPPIC